MARDLSPDEQHLRDSKDRLRAKAKLLRRNLANAHPKAWKKLSRILLDLEPRRIVAGYWPIGDEMDPRGAMDQLVAEQHRTALPVIQGADKPLMFRAWSPNQPLQQGPFGTREPLPEAEEVRPDVLLVPLLAFDGQGYRLGWGGGYYDRTIAALQAGGGVLTIGVAYAGQQVARVPRGPHDQPLDWILTEQGVIEGAAKRGTP
ncbi:hypothetical protein JCM17960_20150 [Magnetospira thiophila]